HRRLGSRLRGGGALDTLIRARLASGNANKLRELRAALPGWQLESLAADAYPPEDGATYLENARIKARFGRSLAAADEWVLGEDSGIEVEALGGGPGIESARWAKGREAEKLLEALVGATNRRARYVCELVALAPDGEPPVDLGAEHDRVRHHVEPHEQEHRATRRLQCGQLLGESQVPRQQLERRLEQARSRHRAGEDVAGLQRLVRQDVIDGDE